MIIGILGRKYNGKDTVANYLVSNYNYTKFAFADPLKEILKTLFGFTDEQLYGNEKEVLDERWGITPRDAMKFIGTEFGRKFIRNFIPNIGDDFWVKHMENKIKEVGITQLIVISDVRHDNEIQFILRNGGTIWKVDRGIINTDTHESENIDQLDYKQYIDNRGTLQQLYSNIDNAINLVE